jgi:hypothetical protein
MSKMSLTAKQPEKIPCIEGDTYQAVCYQVIDLGTQANTMFGGFQKKVMIGWEIPELRIDVERDKVKVNLPRAISKTYTLSLGEKANLRADLVNWRGCEFTQEELDSFDLGKVVSKNCLLTVTNKNNTKGNRIAQVSGVAKLVKNMKAFEPENPILTFDMERDGIQNIPPSLPDWIKKLIMESVEYKGVMHAQNSPELAAAQEAAGMNKEPDGGTGDGLPDF